jgi:hypothetical protein
VSNPTEAGFPYREESILQALADPRTLRYEPDPRGLVGARLAVAGYYREIGTLVDPDNLILCSGTSEGYGHLFKLLCGPGDEILVPKPGYPLLEVLAALEGARHVHYPLRLDEHGWRMDVERLQDTIGTRTVAISVVSPNNPTGSYLKHEELDYLVDLAGRFGLALIVDEVFADYAVGEDPRRVHTTAGEHRALTFVLNGLSKLVGLPQLKLAWIHVSGPDALRREAQERLEFIADAYLSVSSAVQHAAPTLLGDRSRIQSLIRARLDGNERTLREALDHAPGLRVAPREGGWYAVLECALAAAGRTDEELALELLERQGVLVHPGYFYDFEGEAFLVLSLLTPEDVFRPGAGRIASHFR